MRKGPPPVAQRYYPRSIQGGQIERITVVTATSIRFIIGNNLMPASAGVQGSDCRYSSSVCWMAWCSLNVPCVNDSAQRRFASSECRRINVNNNMPRARVSTTASCINGRSQPGYMHAAYKAENNPTARGIQATSCVDLHLNRWDRPSAIAATR